MAVKARFSPQAGSSVEVKNIEGYRISTFFHPTNGFNDNFFIYLHELISAEDDFSPISMATAQSGKIQGTLTIADDANERNYTFNNINLLTSQSFLTHEQKTRLLIFQYRAEITNKGNYCTISNTAKAQDPSKVPSKMGKNYSYRIDGSPEPLVFFASRLSRNSIELFRLGALRNNKNSFLDLAMRMDKEIHPGQMRPKTIIVKGMNLTLNETTLQGLLVDESYGSFLTFGVNSLDTIALTDQAHYAELAKINFSTFNPNEYLAHSQNPSGMKRMNQKSSVETATIILNAGEELDKSSSIV